MKKSPEFYDLIVVGAGAAGMMAAITSARKGKKTLLLEKLSKPGTKLKATGGGRCNFTNTLNNEEFMEHFGCEGRFMSAALNAMDHNDLISFFSQIGVQSHAPDGFHVFPLTHNSQTIISALEKEIKHQGVELKCGQRVEKLDHDGTKITGVTTAEAEYAASNVIIATGGLGYPQFGAEGDGYMLSKTVGHNIIDLYPAMMPLQTKERWVKNCRADTIPKAKIRIELQKKTGTSGIKKLRAKGDLIFTSTGIRGPVILDFSREITPLLKKYGEVTLLINMTRGMNEDEILKYIKNEILKNPERNILEILNTLLPKALSNELCLIAGANPHSRFNSIAGVNRDKLIRILAWTPLTVTGHDDFKNAMITRGGVSLKEIYPETMESRLISGLFFCGEVVNLDGPCGGYNLQWSFSSGFLAGNSLKIKIKS